MATTKSARDLAKKSSNAHSPAPKLYRSGAAGSELCTDAEPKEEMETAQHVAAAAAPGSLSQVLATPRGEVAEAKNVMKNYLMEVRESIDKVCTRVDGMQDSADQAFAPLMATVERHKTSIVEHEQIKVLENRIQLQAAAMKQLRLEVLAVRTAQSVVEETVQEVRREMAMPPDAPSPPLPRTSGGWSRTVAPNVLPANARAMFSDELLVASLAPLLETTNLTLDDIDLQMPSATMVAKRWTMVVKGWDARTAVRKAAMLLGTLREGSGWRKVEVESAAGEKVSLHVAPDKTPRQVKAEEAGKKFVAELKVRFPHVFWRLLREEGIVSAGYQNSLRIVAESSTLVRLE